MNVFLEIDGWRVGSGFGHDGEAVFRVEVDEGQGPELVFASPERSALVRWLSVCAIDPPDALVDAASDLPASLPVSMDRALPRSVILPAGRSAGASARQGGPSRRAEILDGARPEFRQASPEYHGTLWACDAGRLAISPNGRRYLWQRCEGDQFTVARWRKSLAALRPLLPSAVPAAVLDGLPDDPHEVPRPWAQTTAETATALRAINPRRDGFPGVVAKDHSFRLAVSPERDQYWLQSRPSEDAPWRVVRRGDRLAQIAEAVVPLGAGWPDVSGFAVQSDRLCEALAALPDDPADYGEGA